MTPVKRVDDRLSLLQQRLQHRFANVQLLEQALTHRSFSAHHNERLEFLGDAVLNLAVAELLFERLQTLPEGELSRARAGLVRQDTLHPLASKLELPSLLRLGEGERRSGGQGRPSILADALEAVIGAVHLDAGYGAARALVWRLFESVDLASVQAGGVAKDPKTELQEWLQGRRLPLPAYRVSDTVGAAHKQTFNVECEVAPLGLVMRGIGGSRRAGEQAAAAAMLMALKAQNK